MLSAPEKVNAKKLDAARLEFIAEKGMSTSSGIPTCTHLTSPYLRYVDWRKACRFLTYVDRHEYISVSSLRTEA